LPENLQGVVDAKGWKSPTEALDSYVNLEKLLGANKVALPNPTDGDEEWGKFWDSIGRPSADDGYEFNVPDDMPGYEEASSQWFASAAHKAGLTSRQASSLHDAFLEFAAGKQAEMAESGEQQSRELETQLTREWGSAREERTQSAQRAARFFGFDGEATDALEKAVGSFKLLDRLAEIGSKLKDDQFVDGGGTARTNTPASAKTEIAERQRDPEFMKAYMTRSHPGHDDAVAEMQRLHEQAFNG